MRLRGVIGIDHLYEIVDDKGRSCLDEDAVKFGIEKSIKRQLKNILIQVCQALNKKGMKGTDDFIADGLLKKIVRNAKAVTYNLWEIRNSAHGGRLFFIMDDEGNIIVSATDKQTADQKAQEKAINRGIKRWEKLLKNQT